jgi:hypothetical protein
MRLALAFTVSMTVIALGGCDPGNEVPELPVLPQGAPGALPSDPMARVAPPSDEELCGHIVDVSHRELGHLGELDPEVERAALADCVAQVREDRASYGVAFAPLAECTYASDSLAQIAACEDHYARNLAGQNLDTAIDRLTLEEPIVDAELCTHRGRVQADATRFDAVACRNELAALRLRVGNRRFDAFAWCMMDSTSESAFIACESEASEAPAWTPVPESTSPSTAPAASDDSAPPTAAEALTALRAIAKNACACTSARCAARSRDDLEQWTIRFRKAGGTLKEEQDAEMLTARMFACERRVAGPGWLDAESPAAKPASESD